MELDWLDDFLALVETGNFSRAAEARNLTQPAFSRRIKALEDWAGAALIDRSTHRIGLTAAGEVFVEPAQDILRRVRQSREDVRKAAGSVAATLRFAATHALSLTFFPLWLREVENQAPLAAGLQLMSDTMKACEQAMRQGQAHFLLCHYHPAVPVRLDPRYFISVRVGGDILVPVCAPDADGAPRFALSGADDAPVPLLSYSPESALGWIVETLALRREECRVEVVVTAHLATVLRAMARDGRGVAWLPLSLIQPDLDSGALVRAGDPDWDAEGEIHLFRSRARQAAEAEAFWKLVTAQGTRRDPGNIQGALGSNPVTR